MSNIKVSGSASGTGEITIAAPITNSSRTQTLPDATGTVLLDSAATVSGNLAFTGTGNRITGDFTTGTRPNRVMFQTSTADSPTRLGAIPSGTGTVSEFSLYNTSDPSNASTGQLLLNATEFRIANAITGTGTYVPMTFYNNGSEQMRLTTAGNFGIGTSTPSTKLHVNAGRTTLSANNEPYSLQLNNGSVTNGPFLGSAGTDIFVISTGGGAERFRMDSSGNLQVQAGAVVVYQPAPASIATTATLTNADIQAQIINTTGTSYTVTMPLGTTLETLVTWAATNLGYDFSIINTASGTITMAANTGVTTLGALTIATGTSAQFRIRRTAANTFVLYRLS